MPRRREEAFKQVALKRAQELTLYASCDDLDAEVIDALRRDSLIVSPPDNGILVAPAHDVLEDWAILKWIDEQYDAEVVSTVYFGSDIFSGDQLPKAPDLYIGFNIGYRASWQTALGAVPEHTIEDNLRKWSGTHLVDPKLIPGILFSNRYMQSEKPSIYDICPTVLKLIGYDEQAMQKMDLDGKPLF